MDILLKPRKKILLENTSQILARIELKLISALPYNNPQKKTNQNLSGQEKEYLRIEFN